MIHAAACSYKIGNKFCYAFAWDNNIYNLAGVMQGETVKMTMNQTKHHEHGLQSSLFTAFNYYGKGLIY